MHPLARTPYTEADAIREMNHLAHITSEPCYLVLDGIQYHYGSKLDLDTWYPEGWPPLIAQSDDHGHGALQASNGLYALEVGMVKPTAMRAAMIDDTDTDGSDDATWGS